MLSNSLDGESNFLFESNATLHNLSSCIGDWADRKGFDIDLSLESGVLTIDCGKKGVFVLNKQAPNKQIWLASPISGPLRYNFCSTGWTNTRDGHDIRTRLKTELESIFGGGLSLNVT